MTADTYPTPPQGWICFHCGEHFPGDFAGHRKAEEHFGGRPRQSAACLIKEEKGLLRALRAAEREVSNLRADIANETNSSKAYYGRLETDIRGFKPFRECRSLQDVFNVYDSIEGRALTAEEQLRDLAASHKSVPCATADELNGRRVLPGDER